MKPFFPLAAAAVVILQLQTGDIFAQNDSSPLSNAAIAIASTPDEMAPAPATPVTAPPTANPEGQCFPSCRSGFFCHESVCVSACNPPCGANYVCTEQAECVLTTTTAYVPPPPPVVQPKPERKRKTAEERMQTRMAFRKIPRFLFSADIAVGMLKDLRINEFSVHLGMGVRANLADQFGLLVRASLIVGGWQDGTTVPASHRDYDAEYATAMVGGDVELMPYAGPFDRFYLGPVANYRVLRPVQNKVLVEVEQMYGRDVTITFPDEQFFSAGLGGGFLIGDKEMIGIGWRVYSSFTQKMPVYIQVGATFDLPVKGIR